MVDANDTVTRPAQCSDLSKHAFRIYSKDRLQCEQTRRHWLRPLQCPALLTGSAGVAGTAESSFGLPSAAVTGDIGTIFSALARLLARLLLGSALGGEESRHASVIVAHPRHRSSMDTQLRPRRQTLPPLPVYQTVLEKIASRRSACAGKESSFCFLFFLASFFFRCFPCFFWLLEDGSKMGSPREGGAGQRRGMGMSTGDAVRTSSRKNRFAT